MHIFDLLSILVPGLRPTDAKIHLATSNGKEEPIDVYLAGKFDEWQRWQTLKNFGRPYVVSLISLPGRNRWLFAGVYKSSRPKWLADHESWHYTNMVEDERCRELNGRLVVSFARSGRQPYIKAEKWSDQIVVSKIFAERMAIADFPGYRKVNITKGELDLVVRQSLESWRTALSNVAGVYLITDTLSGKLYVGSATGEGGIWSRWSCYAHDGHGGNKPLRALLKEDKKRANHFRYSILEIADVHAGENDVLKRESHWKDVLMSRSHGLNGN